jgi:hypothetical protein
MCFRGIALAVVLLLMTASGAEAQILTFTPSPALAASRNLWVTIVASAAGTVNATVRDSEALLAEPQMFTFPGPGQQTRKIGLNRAPKAVSVEFLPKPASLEVPDMIRSVGASMQPYMVNVRGGPQETALNATVVEPVECNGMICVMCYSLLAESHIEADSLSSPGRMMTYDDFEKRQNRTPAQLHRVQWNQDDQNGSHVSGSYFILLTAENAAGETKTPSRPFSVPGKPPVSSPGSRCPNP